MQKANLNWKNVNEVEAEAAGSVNKKLRAAAHILAVESLDEDGVEIPDNYNIVTVLVMRDVADSLGKLKSIKVFF